MNNTTQITEALKRLIVKDNRAFVAMLSGEWGIGKTYFWKNFVKQQNEERSKINFTYISLFGYNSLQSLKSDIVLKLSKVETSKDIFNKIFQSVKTSLGSKDNNETINVNLSGALVSSALSLIPEKSLKDSVICFDDFERLSDKISLKDVMGLISQFKEQKECKIIMILNEQELDKLSDIDGRKYDDIFALYKEKIVDYNFYYQPTQDELFNIIETDIKNITFCQHQTIYNFFKKIDLKNIRIMKQSLYLLEKFLFIGSEDYHQKIIDEFVEIALNIFVFKAKTNYTYPEFYDFITSPTFYDLRYNEPEPPKRNKKFSKKDLEEKHKINLKYYFREENRNDYSINKRLIEKELYTFIDTHFTDKEKFKTLLKNNNK
ncbi:MAG: P-loop NTPase fold protein, partial [Campylobacterales bacterium]